MPNDYYKKAMIFERYWGRKAYKELANKLRHSNRQEKFTKEEKLQMLSDMVSFIEDKDFTLYHDFMDFASQQRQDWFNFLVFDKKARDTILTYVEFRVQDKKGLTDWSKTFVIDESRICHEEPLERNCTTCEFYNSVCIGSGKRIDNGESTYGMPIEEALEMFPNGCEDYGVSLATYEILEQRDGR